MPVRPALRLAFATLISSAALVMPNVGHAQQTFTIQSLDLYAGPAPDYPIVAHLYAGVQLRVIGCLPDYAWCDVLLPDGRSYCVAVFVTDSRETDGTNAAIAAEISRAAYECFTRNDP